MHGENTLRYQPAKIAAIEGHWRNAPGEAAPLILFGLPNMASETTDYALQIPHLGSLILTHDWNGGFPGLTDFPPRDRPYAPAVFWTFRVMVGIGFLMLALGLWSLWLRFRGGLYESRRFLRFAVLMGPSGVVAILAGWLTTEIGRQPWIVYGVMRTGDAVSNHSALALTLSLGVFVVMYCIAFGAGIFYILTLVGIGPQDLGGDAPPDACPERPFSAAPDPLP